MARSGSRYGTVVLTGATSGIGRAAAELLAGDTERLVLQGPEDEGAVGLPGVYLPCDFTDLADVVRLAERIRGLGPIDVLINNAGVPGAPDRVVTTDGHERTLQVNYLALVLLTELLRPALGRDARVVNLASATHSMTSLGLDDIELVRGYDPVRAYARSKLAIILFTRWWARQQPARPIAVCLNPGVIATGLLHAMFSAGGSPVERGARNILAAVDAPAEGGEYYDDGALAATSREARDARLGDALMEWTRDALRPFQPL